MRKIVQIAFDHYKDNDDDLTSVMWAVCDDGTVWYKSYRDQWEQLEKLPPGCAEEKTDE